MKGVVMVMVAVLAVVYLAATPVEAAITCSDLQSQLSPCLGFVTGGGEPSQSCCSGVKSVAGHLQSKPDRQTACNCMKSAAASYNVQPDVASNLARKCGVSIGMTVSPSMDCSQIS